jgi:hypothetical protein
VISLTGSLEADTPQDLTGYRVSAAYDRALEGGDPPTSPVEQSTAVASDGSWTLTLDFEPMGLVHFTGRTPTGIDVGTFATNDLGAPIVVPVAGLPSPTQIPPTTNPTLGQTVALTGRVLQPDGSGAPSGLAVVLWAKPAASSPLPVLVSGSTDGGYFSGDWPSAPFEQAWGSVNGGEPIVVPLTDGLLPRVVLLVLTSTVQAPSHDAEDDCDCHTPTPPRTPSAADLVANPEAYSQDGGGCVSLTVPNRTLEEITFHAIVRTTQPEIRGTTLADSPALPGPLSARIQALALTTSVHEAAATFEGTRMMTRANSQVLRLDPAVISDAFRTGQPDEAVSATSLQRVQLFSDAKRFRQIIDVIGPYLTPGRVELDSDHAVDWDEDPTIYQATTVAIGHVLTLKQVWRADGYSMGDLLYSLPLAPGQKKQIAIVDWERRDQVIRQSSRDESEQLTAELAHDRDIANIIDSALREHTWGESTANVSAVGGGIGAFIGPIVLGGGGGHSNANSEAHSHDWRDVTATALNQARDRTQQAATAVRAQRSTTIQTTSQGESLRAQTDVVANHNHCHALTMEYFEVLRHFKVSNELADARECLLVPFDISEFTPAKALRWREPLSGSLSRWDLAGGFDALERVRTAWAFADMPVGRYADDIVNYLEGSLTMTFSFPRPADDANDHQVDGNWTPWAALMPNPDIHKIWNDYLGNVLPQQRDAIWNERLAPLAAARLVNSLYLVLNLTNGSTVNVPLDPTLVSRFRQDDELEVSLDADLSAVTVTRSDISSVTIGLGAPAPYLAKVVVRWGSLYYRTDHLAHHLFAGNRIDHELSVTEHATIGLYLDRLEKRSPRREDELVGARLVAHLNERLEYYHQAIWRGMHPNRRYMLLDGVIAPNANGQSVASVVENRVIGIVGNCLVLPVVPGKHLDPNYRSDKERQTSLVDLYAVDGPPPSRVSVPTKGVFAEAVLGACNSCEKKDDTRFWRWEESPIPDQPMPISAVGTDSRRSGLPDLRPDAFPDALVRYQQVPNSPDPTGLLSALKLIGTPNLFRDLSGLDLNQQASAAAFSKALETAQFFGTQAANLAQQRYANTEMDRNLERVKKAVDDKLITPEQGQALTQQFISSGNGRGSSTKPAPTATPAVQKAIERASQSESGSVKVSRPEGSVEVSTGGNGPVDFEVSPAVVPVKQPTNDVCWAAGGTMLMSWKKGTSLTIQAAADAAGGGWRALLDANHALSVAEVRAYVKAIGMSGEAPMCYLPRGLYRLLKAHGPLWVVGDDAVANNSMAHVRVITGLHGDGTSDGTTVTFVDPADGATHQESFADFSAHLEATDASSLGLGFYHN